MAEVDEVTSDNESDVRSTFFLHIDLRRHPFRKAQLEETNDIDERSALETEIRHELYQTSVAINSFLVSKYFFDPRRAIMFLDDVMDAAELERHEQLTPLERLRHLRSTKFYETRLSNSYYELWKVRGDFDVGDLFEELRRCNCICRILICKMIGEDHQNFAQNIPDQL